MSVPHEVEEAFERIRANFVVKEMAIKEAWSHVDRLKKAFPYNLNNSERATLLAFLEERGHDHPVLVQVHQKLKGEPQS